MLELYATAGGIFVILAFVHFFADWIFQSHEQAIKKHEDFSVRGRHCLYYTVPFIFVILPLGVNGWLLLLSILTLFLSHFIIDTYVPVFLWAKYIRKTPTISNALPEPGDWGICKNTSAKKEFANLFKNSPVHAILFITVDQILHLLFLWPVVFFILL